MKKTIIAALTMLTLWTTQADYILKYPLEQAQGGSLPNGSINIKTPTPSYPNTHACFIDNFKNGFSIITVNGICIDGVFTAKISGGLNGINLVGTCTDGNYFFPYGLGTNSGTCRTQ
jgi:hypothetical protein